MSGEVSPLFRGRKPTELKFGTSGLRGLVSDMTDLEVWINAEGFITFLKQTQRVRGGDSVYVSHDLRPSSPRMAAAVCACIEAQGLTPRLLSPVPTPALAYVACSNRSASIMVTGSHIPFDRNGIKFYRPDGEVLKSDEVHILSAVAVARASNYASSEVRFADDGMLIGPASNWTSDASGEIEASRKTDASAKIDASAEAIYLQRYIKFFGDSCLSGLNIAVYQHSAVGRDLLVSLLEGLGARVAPIGRSEDFIAVDTEAVDDAMVARIAEFVPAAREALGGLDAVVSTDGDSDRPLLLAADEKGQLTFIRGDSLGAMVSEALDLDAVAIPVSVSDQVDLHLEHLGVALHRTRIGSPWVIEAMSDMPGVRKGGFEANGGFLLETSLEEDGRILERLATRDAVLPLVSVLASTRKMGTTLLRRFQSLPARSTTAGLLDGIEPSVSKAFLSPWYFEDCSEAWLSPIRVRYPGREAENLPSFKQDVLCRLAETVSELWEGHGLGSVIYFNWVDGIRMKFSSGDVLHLRPSGNAPQFRVYVTSDSMARARALVEAAVGPGGVVASKIAHRP